MRKGIRESFDRFSQDTEGLTPFIYLDTDSPMLPETLDMMLDPIGWAFRKTRSIWVNHQAEHDARIADWENEGGACLPDPGP